MSVKSEVNQFVEELMPEQVDHRGPARAKVRAREKLVALDNLRIEPFGSFTWCLHDVKDLRRKKPNPAEGGNARLGVRVWQLRRTAL